MCSTFARPVFLEKENCGARNNRYNHYASDDAKMTELSDQYNQG